VSSYFEHRSTEARRCVPIHMANAKYMHTLPSMKLERDDFGIIAYIQEHPRRNIRYTVSAALYKAVATDGSIPLHAV
jgi:hypothetical protein